MHKEFNDRFAQMEAMRNNLLNGLKSTPEAILMKSPGTGRWSALQTVQHLVVAETGTNKYLRKKILGKEKVPFSGIANLFRMSLGKVILRLPIKFKAPEMVANPPANVGLNNTIAQWNATRNEFKEIVMALEAKDLKRELFKHPFMGRLDIFQTMDFFEYHLSRHKKQVERTIKEVQG